MLTSVGIAPPKTTDAQALGKLRFAGSWAFDGGAIGIDPFTLVLDDTHFTRQLSSLRGRQTRWANSRCAATRSTSRATSRPPTRRASPSCCPRPTLKALMFRGSVELEHATLDDIDMKGVTLRLLLDEKGLRSEAKPPEAAP